MNKFLTAFCYVVTLIFCSLIGATIIIVFECTSPSVLLTKVIEIITVLGSVLLGCTITNWLIRIAAEGDDE